MRLGILAFSAVYLVGCSSNAAEGVLTDALSGQPIAEQKLVAKAVGDKASLTCMAFEATTDAAGAYKLGGLCSGTSYTITPADAQWWVADGNVVPEAGAPGAMDLKAYRIPGGAGIYMLDVATHATEPVRTASDLQSEPLPGGTERARYPKNIPGNVAVLSEGKLLIFSGETYMDGVVPEPMLRTGERKFVDGTATVTIPPWYYIGLSFTSDTEFKTEKAAFDPAKITDVRDPNGGKNSLRYVQPSALPNGRYALLKDGDRRVTMIDVGEAQPKASE